MSLIPVLVALSVLCGAVALVGAHASLLVDILAINAPDEDWTLGPITFDITDMAFAAAFAGLLATGASWQRVREIPHLGLWLVLGVLVSVSYVSAPVNQAHLGGPHELLYQLYRYAWRPILFYPLAMLLLGNPDRIRQAMLWMIAAGSLIALQAIPQGYLGSIDRASGPLDSGNALGGALAPVLVLCAGFYMSPERRRVRIFALVSALLMIRAITFSGSRGGLIAAGLAWGRSSCSSRACPSFARTSPERPRSRSACSSWSCSSPRVSSSRPRRCVDSSEMRESIRSRPWIGVCANAGRILRKLPSNRRGSELGMMTDPALGERGATPHNAYLGIAVLYGLPVTVLMLIFAFLAMRAAAMTFFSARPPPLRFLSALAGAALVTVLLHNVIETLLLITFGRRYFWLLIAFCIALERGTNAPARTSTEPQIQPRV